MGDDDKKVSDHVDVTYPEGRNVPVDRPPNRSPYGMPAEGWLTASNVRHQLSGLYCHIWADLTNTSDLPYEAGELLFTISAEGNRRDYHSGHVVGEQAHSAEKVEHYSEAAVPAKGSVTVLLGTIGLDPGYYEVQVQIQDAKTRDDAARDPAMLYVDMPGERQQPEFGSSYPMNSGGIGPNDVRVQITQVVDLGAAQDGNHEYGIHFKLDVMSADEQDRPTRQPNALEATLRASSNQGLKAEESHWINNPVPEGAWEAYHQLDLMLQPHSEWDITIDLGLDGNKIVDHRVQVMLGIEGDVLGITSYG